MTEIPEEFVCPITKEVMVYPYITAAGNTYEYAAITEWLKKSNLDPLTNLPLKDTKIFPNNSLRSQIISWHEKKKIDMPTAELPIGEKFVPHPNLEQVLTYQGKKKRNEDRKEKKFGVPESFSAFNHKYTFVRKTEASKSVLYVQCDNGTEMAMPTKKKEMFFTKDGIVFYDPSYIRETRVLPDTDFKEKCSRATKCTKKNCSFAHPFVCPKGTTCAGCKFLHPASSSIVSLGKVFPVNIECKYGVSCSSKKCKFAHSLGRMSVPRNPARVFLTHSLTLQELQTPIAIKLDVPEKATNIQFQGDFVFFFVPYVGTWAKEHYQQVMVHRFDPISNSYKYVGTYSLDKHYCNSIVGSGRYVVISFWPYEDEAIRAVWEGIKYVRATEKDWKAQVNVLNKELKEKDVALQEKDAEIRKLKGVIADQNTQMANTKAQVHAVNEELRQEKIASHALSQAYERERMERFRLRDPIHIYALQENCSGFAKQDWKLVLDYHKGAHNLELSKPNTVGVQHLKVTEHDAVYCFGLNVPSNVNTITNLPFVPERLCADF